MTPIRLFWYRAEANFGDALAPLAVAHVSGRPVEWAARDVAEMYSAGSLMTMIANAGRDGGAGRPVIWGSGCMGPVGRDFFAQVDVAAVRGPLTADMLGLTGVPMGDPGVFASELAGTLPAREDRVGIVPHLTRRDDPALHAAVAADERLTLIDPATTDAAGVIRQIAACAYVLSSSLHGLVVADACGVPNAWLDPDGIHAHARFKFHDYAAGVGRDLGTPVAVDGISAHVAGRLPETIAHGPGVTEARHALSESFPAHLRARPADAAA